MMSLGSAVDRLTLFGLKPSDAMTVLLANVSMVSVGR